MDFRTQLQLDEACGALNCWFCSQAYGRPIEDPETLMRHYIRRGGAADFAKRYAHAMSTLNRWYCSEFYRRDIRDPEILWQYYMKYAPGGAVGKERRNDPGGIQGDMNIAC